MSCDQRVGRARHCGSGSVPALQRFVAESIGALFGAAILAAGAGCASGQRAAGFDEAIRGVLAGQEAAWNEGDIEAYMEPYWHSAELTFSSGGKMTRGWQPTLENYHRRYPSREAMGHLTFSDLEITRLGDAAALVLGRWHLDRADPVGGVFTLVFRRIGERWVIVHDHTSRAPASNGKAGG